MSSFQEIYGNIFNTYPFYHNSYLVSIINNKTLLNIITEASKSRALNLQKFEKRNLVHSDNEITCFEEFQNYIVIGFTTKAVEIYNKQDFKLMSKLTMQNKDYAKGIIKFNETSFIAYSEGYLTSQTIFPDGQLKDNTSNWKKIRNVIKFKENRIAILKKSSSCTIMNPFNGNREKIILKDNLISIHHIPMDRLLITSNGCFYIWERGLPKSYKPFSNEFTSFHYLENNNILAATIPNSNNLYLMLDEDYLNPVSLEGHNNTILTVAELPNNDIITSSNDCTMRIWNGGFKCISIIKGYSHPIITIRCLKNNLITVSQNNSLIRWDIRNSWNKFEELETNVGDIREIKKGLNGDELIIRYKNMISAYKIV
jgi:hypothetical protein